MPGFESPDLLLGSSVTALLTTFFIREAEHLGRRSSEACLLQGEEVEAGAGEEIRT